MGGDDGTAGGSVGAAVLRPPRLRAPRRAELGLLGERLGLDGLLEVGCPLDLGRDARVAEVGGRVVGTCWVRVVSGLSVFSADGAEAFFDALVDPDRHATEAAALVGWAVARATSTCTCWSTSARTPSPRRPGRREPAWPARRPRCRWSWPPATRPSRTFLATVARPRRSWSGCCHIPRPMPTCAWWRCGAARSRGSATAAWSVPAARSAVWSRTWGSPPPPGGSGSAEPCCATASARWRSAAPPAWCSASTPPTRRPGACTRPPGLPGPGPCRATGSGCDSRPHHRRRDRLAPPLTSVASTQLNAATWW